MQKSGSIHRCTPLAGHSVLHSAAVSAHQSPVRSLQPPFAGAVEEPVHTHAANQLACLSIMWRLCPPSHADNKPTILQQLRFRFWRRCALTQVHSGCSQRAVNDTSKLPRSAAQCNAVQPSASLDSMSAPLSSRNATAEVSPSLASRCRLPKGCVHRCKSYSIQQHSRQWRDLRPGWDV